MGKTTETTENTTPSSAELELLEAQEKISQLEAKLKEEQEAKAEAEKAAEKAQNEAEAAKAEAEKIANEAKTKEDTKVTTVVKPQEEKRVKIKLFKDSKEYKDDLTVVVNGKAYQIQRGVEVEVPESVAEVIEHSAVQDQKTAELIDSLIAETEQREKELR